MRFQKIDSSKGGVGVSSNKNYVTTTFVLAAKLENAVSRANLRIAKPFGKLGRPSVILVGTAEGPFTSCLRITDIKNNITFLVDTGADISVLPRSAFIDVKSSPASAKHVLYAANGSTIPTYGSKTIEIDIGLGCTFNWEFTIANVAHPILGADFIKRNGLLVDLRNRKLLKSQAISTTTFSKQRFLETPLPPCQQQHTASIRETVLWPISVDNPVYQTVKQFDGISKRANNQTPKHNIRHHINTRHTRGRASTQTGR